MMLSWEHALNSDRDGEFGSHARPEPAFTLQTVEIHQDELLKVHIPNANLDGSVGIGSHSEVQMVFQRSELSGKGQE